MVARRLVTALVLMVAASLTSWFAPSITAQSSSSPGTVSPLCRTGCGGGTGSPVLVTPQGTNTDSVFTGGGNDAVTFTVKNTGTASDTYTLTMGCSNTACVSESRTSVTLAGGQSTGVDVIFTPGTANTTGTVTLNAADAGGGQSAPLGGGPRDPGADAWAGTSSYSSTGWWNIVNVAGPAPIVSLAPYSPSMQPAHGAVVYAHRTPVIGSMGQQWALSLIYSSAAAHPVVVVTVDVRNPPNVPQWWPTAYELQVQNPSTGAFYTLMNGNTGVYYTAATGSTDTTRLVAALDAEANGLSTGAYPVNVVVSSVYSGGSAATSVASRILVNDQSASPYGAGVLIGGMPQLHTVQNSYGMLLVGSSGDLSYFDRTCPTCAFISPAGESAKLSTGGPGYILTELDSSKVEFDAQGRVVDYRTPYGHVGLEYTWSGSLLKYVTDSSSGRGFTVAFSGGYLQSVEDFANRTTSVTISGGQLVAVTDPDGLKDSLMYGAHHLLDRVRNRAGDISAFAYNGLDQEQSDTAPADYDDNHTWTTPTTATVTPEAAVWRPGYAGTLSNPEPNTPPDSALASVTDALGRVTRTAVDRLGNPVELIDALGEVTLITRDTLGNATFTQLPSGDEISDTYNGYLRLTRFDAWTGETHRYTYTTYNRLATDSGGAADYLYTYYDGTGGPAGTLKRVALNGITTDTLEYHYPDAFGRDTAVVDNMQNRTRRVYAAASAGGNLLQAYDPAGRVTTTRYNGYGLPDTVTTLFHGVTATRITHYDIMSRPDSATDANGHVTVTTYSPRGVTQIKTPNGDVYHFDINAWGLTVARHDLGNAALVDSLGYDGAGQLRRHRLRDGTVVTMTYDALGRDSTIVGPDFPADTFHYGILQGQHGPTGTYTVAANANAHDSVAYSPSGHPVYALQRMPGGTSYAVSYGYDGHARLTSRTAPPGGHSTAWAYDLYTGLLDTVTALGTQMVVGRDADLAPNALTYRLIGGQASWTRGFQYDADHRDTSDTYGPSALQAAFGMTWQYDSVGHITVATQGTSATYRYAYDQTGQLATACKMEPPWYCVDEYGQNVNSGDQQWDTLVANYSYDPAGNRGYVEAGNRVTAFGNYALTYDANGEVTQTRWAGQDTTVLRWNALGELRWVHRDSAGVAATDSMLYDALGRRVGKIENGVTTWYVLDGGQVVLDVAAATHNVLREYAWLPSGDLYGLDVPGQTPLIALSSPASHSVLGLVTADSGRVGKRYDDSAFVSTFVTAWSPQRADTGLVVRYRMGGQEYDQEIGLYHLGARYYDPVIGRFLSEDPAGVAASLNLYTYAGNDPVNGRDPSGMIIAYSNINQGVTDAEQPWLNSGIDDGGGGVGWMDENDQQAAQDDQTWTIARTQRALAALQAALTATDIAAQAAGLGGMPDVALAGLPACCSFADIVRVGRNVVGSVLLWVARSLGYYGGPSRVHPEIKQPPRQDPPPTAGPGKNPGRPRLPGPLIPPNWWTVAAPDMLPTWGGGWVAEPVEILP